MHTGSVQEWAMASGCCRAMFTAPLEAASLEHPEGERLHLQCCA